MNISKYFIVIFFSFSYHILAQDVTLNISLDKNEYLKGEPIYLLAVLENKSASNITINPFSTVYSLSDLEIFLNDQNDSLLKQTDNFKLGRGSKIILKSNEKAVSLIPIHRRFANNSKEDMDQLSGYTYYSGNYIVN
jgi:hypothetical protein